MLPDAGRSRITILTTALLLLQFSGCSSFLREVRWPKPETAYPDLAILRDECSVRPGTAELANAEIAYAQAEKLYRSNDATCIDQYFRAATFAWKDVDAQLAKSGKAGGRALDLYHSSLNAIVEYGQRYDRLDPKKGLRIQCESGWRLIPVIQLGFIRGPEDFTKLETVGDYQLDHLNNRFCNEGLGVPIVVIKDQQHPKPFLKKKSAFSATFLIRPTDGEAGVDSDFAIELYDPYRSPDLVIGERTVPLSRDKTAVVARAISVTDRFYLQSFLQPATVKPEASGLFMVEPYRPGKIPVIFVHGLLSDRMTWTNMVNEITGRPEFYDKYQVWGFEYPTGEPFLGNATLLRQQISELRTLVDPECADSALDNILLVGHSMGGLISKLQVTESGEDVWNAISFCPFEQVKMNPEYRKRFAEAVFFQPVPNVTRVVFIGTPHRGSGLAKRSIGKLGAFLVKEPEELKKAHDQLVNDNPDAFSDEFYNRVPTSIDLLNPDSPLLAALDKLPFTPCVTIHTIYGGGNWSIGEGESDGVVPVDSARHQLSSTEREVSAKHDKMTHDLTVSEELLSIMVRHELGTH